MALSDLVDAVQAYLRTVPGLDCSIPEDYPQALANERTLLVYGIPGSGALESHAGRHGGPVVMWADMLVMEFHILMPGDQVARGIQEVAPVVELLREAFWQGMADRYGRRVVKVGALDTQDYGDIGFNGVDTWGFRFVIDLTHGQQIG